jgi:hypothetical protein
MSFDPNKPCQTRQGRSARVVATDLAGSKPLCVVLRSDRGEDYPVNYRSDGTFTGYSPHPYDLINIPEKIGGWLNIYRRRCDYNGVNPGVIWVSRAEADRDAAASKRIACIEISVTKGEGL